jgi:hypothetical protein
VKGACRDRMLVRFRSPYRSQRCCDGTSQLNGAPSTSKLGALGLDRTSSPLAASAHMLVRPAPVGSRPNGGRESLACIPASLLRKSFSKAARLFGDRLKGRGRFFRRFCRRERVFWAQGRASSSENLLRSNRPLHPAPRCPGPHSPDCYAACKCRCSLGLARIVECRVSSCVARDRSYQRRGGY